MTVLLDWLGNPSTSRGMYVAQPDGSWQRWPYDRLAGLARRYAQALVRAGVRPGDVVTIVEENGPHFVGLLFATLLTGATASPLAPPPSFGDRERYADHLRGALGTAQPRLVVYHPRLAAVGTLCAGIGVPALASPELLEGTIGQAPTGTTGLPPWPDPQALALLQFTSGTSGRVRGVRVPHRALAANVAAIRQWLAMTVDDATASWLPAHHDMGLVGCLLAPIAGQSDLWLMSPSDFIRRPLRYLECFGRHGARLTAMPAFGLDHIVRRVPPQSLHGMDFSNWRAVIVGAERVSPTCLQRFAALGEPHGLRRSALLPAYGLAEATLAVTGVRLHTGWRSAAHADGEVVGCGPPLAGVRVEVVGADGRQVPAGATGEIVVGGDGVSAGYAQAPVGAGYSQAPQAGATTIAAGQLRTGDAGFLRDGELFVLGRLGDSVKVRGRAIYAEDVEAAAAAACDAPAGRIVALLGNVGDQARLVLMLEHPRPDWLEPATEAARAAAAGTEMTIVVVASGGVSRTSSGKPRRRQLWSDYLAGRLPLAHPAVGVAGSDDASSATSSQLPAQRRAQFPAGSPRPASR